MGCASFRVAEKTYCVPQMSSYYGVVTANLPVSRTLLMFLKTTTILWLQPTISATWSAQGYDGCISASYLNYHSLMLIFAP